MSGDVFHRQSLDSEKRVFSHHATTPASAAAATRRGRPFFASHLATSVRLIANFGVGGVVFQLQTALFRLQRRFLQAKGRGCKRQLLALAGIVRFKFVASRSFVERALGSGVSITAIAPGPISARGLTSPLAALGASALGQIAALAAWRIGPRGTASAVRLVAAPARLLAATSSTTLVTAVAISIASGTAGRFCRARFFAALISPGA